MLQISHLLCITVRRIILSHILVNRGTSLCRTSRHYISRNHTIQSGVVPGGRINTVAGDLISSSNIRKRSGGYLYIHPFFRQFCHGSPIFIPGSVFRIDHSGLIFSVQRAGRMPSFTVDVSHGEHPDLTALLRKYHGNIDTGSISENIMYVCHRAFAGSCGILLEK